MKSLRSAVVKREDLPLNFYGEARMHNRIDWTRHTVQQDPPQEPGYTSESCRRCGSKLWPIRNCKFCSEPVLRTCRSCDNRVDSTHKHGNNNLYSVSAGFTSLD